jgi:integrase
MKTGFNEASWTYRFEFEGRRFTMVKRNKCKAGTWSLKVIIDGQKMVRSLETNMADAAIKRAQGIIKEAKAGNWKTLEKTKLRDDYAKLGTVITTYGEMSAGRTAPLTLRNNVNSFRLVVRRGMGNDGMSDDAVDDLSSSVLTGKLVSGFEDWMCRQAVKQKRDLESNKRSVAGYLRHARSLFKKGLRHRYSELGVKLADVSEFMSRYTERAAKIGRTAPDAKLVNATFAAALKLRGADRQVYIAFLLGLCSLRRGEIAKMQWSWIVSRGNDWAILIPGECAKAGTARMVPIDSRVRLEVEAYRPQRCVGLDLDEEQFVIPSPRIGQGGGSCRLRGQNVFKRLNKFMRQVGWKSNHTLHEMRALALSWVRDNHGLDTAQAVAGHSTNRTTQESYVGLKGVCNVTVNLPLAIGE